MTPSERQRDKEQEEQEHEVQRSVCVSEERRDEGGRKWLLFSANPRTFPS